MDQKNTIDLVIKTILECNGIVYGGAVRDLICRDHFSKKFKQIGDANQYNDPNYMPELKDRLLIPTDIDAYIRIDDVEKLEQKLEELGFSTNIRITENNYHSCDQIEVHETIKLKSPSLDYIIKSVKKSLPPIITMNQEILNTIIKNYKKIKPIKIDLFITEKSFGPMEFMCNNLILTKHGFSVSEKFGKASFEIEPLKLKIIDQIINKKAIIPNGLKKNEINEFRVDKMIKKGYTIEGFSNFSYIQETYNGHCIICHDSVSSKKHYKMKCCDARFHTHCLIQAIEQNLNSVNNCQMCKKRLYKLEDDFTIIDKIYRNYKNCKK